MFLIEASGSWYDIGYQTGQATRYAVASTVDFLAKQFRHWDDARFQRVRDRHMAATERRCPEMIEEVAGLADGTGLPFSLMYLTSFYASMRAGHEGCSNIILRDTPDGPLLAKTNDLPVSDGKHSAIRLLRPEDGPAMLTLNWVGTVWAGTGVSEAGLAIGGSSCSAQVPEPDEVMNPHAMGGYILRNAESVDDAIRLLAELDASAWGANWALVDKTGNAAIVEKAGALQGVRRPDGDRIWCSNYALTEELSPHRANSPESLDESVARFEAIDRLTADAPPTDALLRNAVAFNGRPGALCRYGDDDPLKYETECAFVASPRDGWMQFCFSHPDRDPWYQVSLAGGEPKAL